MKIILASKSPRRIDYLRALGLTFQVQAPNIDETPKPGERPESIVERLAREKAQAIAALNHEACHILSADTLVVFENQVLGKPRDAEEAKLMLTQLSGKAHKVVSGWALLTQPENTLVSGFDTTHICFRQLLPEEITAYVANGEPLDKAGAYAIQGGAAGFVTQRKGSLSNVIGLPLQTVVPILAKTLKTPSLLLEKAFIMDKDV
jgi:septum formation protein